MCPSRLGGVMQSAKAAHGRFSLAGSSLLPGLRARRARFPTCGVVRVAGYSVVWDCDPTPIFSLKSTKRSAAAISRSQRSFITFHGALRDILLSAGFSAMFYMITSEQTFVNDSLQKIFSCWCHFCIESILSVIYISLPYLYLIYPQYIFILLRWIFQRRISQDSTSNRRACSNLAPHSYCPYRAQCKRTGAHRFLCTPVLLSLLRLQFFYALQLSGCGNVVYIVSKISRSISTRPFLASSPTLEIVSSGVCATIPSPPQKSFPLNAIFCAKIPE